MISSVHVVEKVDWFIPAKQYMPKRISFIRSCVGDQTCSSHCIDMEADVLQQTWVSKQGENKCFRKWKKSQCGVSQTIYHSCHM